jgi:pyruvate formate lyase activating enzyme
MTVRIAGFQRFTLSDFPGRTAAIVFTQGCNFRCPFCHNGSLIPAEAEGGAYAPEARILSLLERRRGLLDGLVVTGGEPTLQGDLAEFLGRVKGMGFAVKLDTNGSRPSVIRRLLAEGRLDYIAMDVKAPAESYDRLSGVSTPIEAVRESIGLIARSGVAHEFRTTVVRPFLSEEDIRAIRELLPAGSPHTLQPFNPEHALDRGLRLFVPPPRNEAEEDSKSA